MVHRIKKPYFICDIDDILCDCSEAVRQMYNKKFGTNLAPATRYSTIAAFPEIGQKGESWFKRTYVNGKIMGNLPVISGAQKMLGEIEKEFRVVYATHRPDTIFIETNFWLKNNGFPQGALFCGHGSKSNFRKNVHAPAVVIDDNAENLTNVVLSSEHPTLAICVTMPHNENEPLPEGAIRINDYTQIPIVARHWKEQNFEHQHTS